jgi:hypothetical protein
MQCKAFSRRNQQQCRNHAIKGLQVCRMHGGKTPRGPSSANYNDGRHSKFLPSRMFAAYREAGLDPELMELRDDIALLDARIIDVLKRVDTGEAGVIWQAAQAAMVRFDREWAQKDGAGMELALADMRRLMPQGAADYAAWREIGELIEQRRKLVESEQRRLTLAHEIISRDQAMALVGQVVDILQRHVRDRNILNDILLDVQALGHRGNGNGHTADADPHAITS